MSVPARLQSRPAQITLVAGAAVAVAVFVITVPTFRHFFDLGVYRGAVHYWLIEGGNLYDYRYQDSAYGFTYPPFAALLFAPLVMTSWSVAVAISLVVNSAMVVLLLRWFLVPILRRQGWPIWTPCALAFLAVLVFEPALDTFSFGQINLVLLVLVCTDLRGLTSSLTARRRTTGIGIGLAAAIKLTPAVFIGYLLLSRQYKAAATAAGTAVGATVLTAVVAPGPTRDFWTDALWDTGRVGKLDYVSNQSLRGVVARLNGPADLWVAAVLLVLAYWAWWVRARREPVDHWAGFAVTGIVACLISPITWVHHLVWVLPAMFWLLDKALRDDPARQRPRLIGLAAAYVLLSSSFVWLWWAHPFGWVAFGGANLYVWIAVTLAVTISLADQDPWSALRRGATQRSDVAG